MVISVDLGAEPPAVVLVDLEDCQRFQVKVAGGTAGGTDGARLARALATSGMGRLDDDGAHAWIFLEAVRRAAAGRVADSWPAAFEAMVAYASSKGWLSPGGEEIRAHVERPA